jgi:hypothetical protein
MKWMLDDPWGVSAAQPAQGIEHLGIQAESGGELRRSMISEAANNPVLEYGTLREEREKLVR